MLTFQFLPLFILFPQFVFTKTIPKVGIIGGGIAGTSCAYFLKSLFQNDVSVSLFEKDAVGGRLRLMEVDGYKYEAGGSVIHPRNQYMVEFSKLLNLGFLQPQSTTLGIYNGEKFVLEESDLYLFTIANLFWRYGSSLFHLFRDVKSMLDDFGRIYNLQEKGYAYTTVNLLLDSMNPKFTNMTQATLFDILLQRGYSQTFVNELVESIMMVNYGQTTNISGFAGFVSLAGAENNLWSVEGGNHLIPEGLLKLSNAQFIKSNVVEVGLLPDEKFSIKYQESGTDGSVKSKKFDIVVLSAPLVNGNTNIKFVNFNKSFQQFQRTYHQTVSTFVKGTLNPSVFNKISVPEEILTNNNTLLFNSISKCSPVDNVKLKGEKSVYKVFSQKVLNKESIEKFFRNIDVVKEKVWLAYPHYKPPEIFVPFILHPGLYYTNAIELSASAMEMSTIAAKNIALLIFNSWENSINKIDPHNIPSKDEL